MRTGPRQVQGIFVTMSGSAATGTGHPMEPGASRDITQLLLAWNEGDQQALDRLMPLVFQELHRLAHHYMAGERRGHPLQTTALVNEAYLRLVDSSRVRWRNRVHF